METVTIEGCQLEIDTRRGVIWVHGPNGLTLLRICNLPAPVPNPFKGMDAVPEMLDVTHMRGADWKGEMKI